MIKMEKTFLNCFKSIIDKEEEINPTKNIINNSNNTTNNIKTYLNDIFLKHKEYKKEASLYKRNLLPFLILEQYFLKHR